MAGLPVGRLLDAQFQGAEMLVNGVPVSLDDVTAYSIPDGWVDFSGCGEGGALEVTDDGRGILSMRLEGHIQFRPKQG
jgi:hypothetical protein